MVKTRIKPTAVVLQRFLENMHIGQKMMENIQRSASQTKQQENQSLRTVLDEVSHLVLHPVQPNKQQ